MTQTRLWEQYCCNCKHYKPSYRSGYIIKQDGTITGDGKGNHDGCTLHGTIVLKHSRACEDYNGVNNNE